MPTLAGVRAPGALFAGLGGNAAARQGGSLPDLFA